MKLVLLPGLDGTGILFRPLLKSLPNAIEPIVIDYPIQQALGYDDLHALTWKKLPRDEHFVLLGESFGGPLALRLAAANPSGLMGVILSGSFVTCPYTLIPPWFDKAIRPFMFRTFPFFLKLQSVLGLYESEEHAALGREAITKVAPAVFAHRVREIVKVNVCEELKSCPVPILYLQGTRDQIVRAHNLRRVRSLRSDITVAEIDSGHMILKTRPAESAKAIAEFILKLNPRNATSQ